MKKIAASIAVLAAITAAAQAPALAPAGPMTLGACVALALQNNPSLRASEFAVRASAESEGAAKSSYFPSLAFKGGYRRWESHAFLPNFIYSLPFGKVEPVIGPTNQYYASVEGSYTIFDGGLRKARLDAAIANTGTASSDRAGNRADVILSVTTAFYTLAASRSGLLVARQSEKRSEDHLRLAEERKAVGAVPLADVLRARVKRADAKLAVVHSQSLVDVARGALATAMGLSPDAPVEIVQVTGEIESPTPVESAGAFTRAEENRPEMKAAIERVKAAEAAVRASKSAYAPKVELDGAYGRLDNAWFPQDRDWSLGLVVRVPLFTGFERGHELARAKLELAMAEALRDQQAIAVRREVWDAGAQANEAADAVAAVRSLVADAKESLHMAEERYRVGAGTITDFLDAETNLASAQSQEVHAVFQYYIARAAFERAAGGA